MTSTTDTQQVRCNAPRQTTPGRLAAAVVYVLFLGSIMAVVTAPIGALIAHIKRGRVSAVADSHLLFQIRTFWLGAVAGVLMLALWPVPIWLGLPGWLSWVVGYSFFTACLMWTIGRCGVGINRLMNGEAIPQPRSLLFGGAAISLKDEV